jgi:hypothetical protein
MCVYVYVFILYVIFYQTKINVSLLFPNVKFLQNNVNYVNLIRGAWTIDMGGPSRACIWGCNT